MRIGVRGQKTLKFANHGVPIWPRWALAVIHALFRLFALV